MLHHLREKSLIIFDAFEQVRTEFIEVSEFLFGRCLDDLVEFADKIIDVDLQFLNEHVGPISVVQEIEPTVNMIDHFP